MFRSTFARPSRNRIARNLRTRLLLSPLERRDVPTVYTVNLLSDDGSSSGATSGDLRYCITQANASVGVPDIINFDNAATAGQTISVGSTLTITDPVTINGPTLVSGKPNCAIDGGSAVQIFNVNETSGVTTISFSNLTVQNGLVGGSGAGIILSSVEDTYNFTDMIFQNCVGGNYGGAIGTAETQNIAYGSVNITRCSFLNNSNGTNFGGAVALVEDISGVGITKGWTSHIVDTTFDGNQCTRNGGAFFTRGYNQTVTMDRDTFSNNMLSTTGFGGAISNLSGAGAQSSTFTFNNCTFSANADNDLAAGAGAVMSNGGSATPTITFNNCTFFGNTGLNGNVFAASSGAPVVTFANCILNNNTGGNAISGAISPTFKYCILPASSAMGPFTNGGNNQFNTDALLGPLGTPNGGITAYHFPGPGSPARETGVTIPTVTTDQRGVARPIGGKYDIGSIESSDPTPIGSASASDVLAPAAGDYTFSVTYSDDVAVKFASIKASNVTVTGPNSFTAVISLAPPVPTMDGTPLVANYKFTPPGGTWDFTDNGSYTVTMNPMEVTDGMLFVQAGTLTTFNCAIPQNFIVSNTNDSGAGSLRQAITDANNALGAIDNVTFAPAVQGKTITLSSEIPVTEGVNITGPTVGSPVTIDGGMASRFLNVSGAGIFAVTIANLTIQNCSAANGGAFLTDDETIVANNDIFSGNAATSLDGGVVNIVQNGGRFDATDCTFTGNTAAGNGAVGATTNVNGTITMTRCTATGNTASGNGGVLSVDLGGYVITSSTLSGNTAAGGGALVMTQVSATMIISDSTIDGNMAGTGAGILANNQGGLLQIRNSTVTDAINHVGTSTQPSNISVVSSIVTSIDVVNAGISVTYSNSIVGAITGNGTVTDGGGNLPIGTDPALGPLAKNGGTTMTRGLLPGSPALDKGVNPDGLTYDQRGSAAFPTFVRTLNGATDIGAFEGTLPVPGGTLTPFGPITVVSPNPNTLSIVLTDAAGIDTTTIGKPTAASDITIKTPSGGSLTVTNAMFTPPGGGTSVTATYTFNVPVNAAAGWDASDNGTYTVILNAGQIANINGATNPQLTAGTFVVAIPSTYTVDLASDVDDGLVGPGQLTLREAIRLSNNDNGPSTINFAAGYSGTVTVASEMAISQPVTINGTTIPANATFNGGGANRLFNIDVAGSGGNNITISNMVLTNGKPAAGDGGGILDQDENLTLTNVSITNCATQANGGGISVTAGTATITLNGCTISNNTATAGATAGSIGQGGGINLHSASTVLVNNSTISGNMANEDGGGFYFYNTGGLNVTGSTISGNKADITATGQLGGGGVYFYGKANATGVVISNSTFSGNDAGLGLGGGGIMFQNGLGAGLIQNSTFSGNTALGGGTTGYGGGVLVNAGGATVLTIRNSTFTLNQSTKGGGGLTIAATASPVINSTIIAGNTNAGSATDAKADVDSIGTLTVTGSNNLIGINDATTKLSFGAGNPLIGTTGAPQAAGLDTTLKLNGAAAGTPLTHALLPGSAAINAGNNNASLMFDERGSPFQRTSGSQTDIGAFEVQAPAKLIAAPNDILVNGVANAGAQRSMVTSLKISFDSHVTFVGGDANAAAAFSLVNQKTSGSVTLAAGVDNSGTGTVVSLTFTGGSVEFKSLSDGRYTFKILASGFSGNGFDGNGNGVADGSPADDYTEIGAPGSGHNLIRLFGDADGNGTVNSADFLAFRSAFGTSNPTFDYDGNGTVNTGDFLRFRSAFGTSV